MFNFCVVFQKKRKINKYKHSKDNTEQHIYQLRPPQSTNYIDLIKKFFLFLHLKKKTQTENQKATENPIAITIGLRDYQSG